MVWLGPGIRVCERQRQPLCLRVRKGYGPAVVEDELPKEGRRYLGDSRKVHQSEVDHVRGEDLQVDGLVADPLKMDKQNKTENELAAFSFHVHSINDLERFFGGGAGRITKTLIRKL